MDLLLWLYFASFQFAHTVQVAHDKPAALWQLDGVKFWHYRTNPKKQLYHAGIPQKKPFLTGKYMKEENEKKHFEDKNDTRS